jgi:hypothetical protein
VNKNCSIVFLTLAAETVVQQDFSVYNETSTTEQHIVTDDP